MYVVGSVECGGVRGQRILWRVGKCDGTVTLCGKYVGGDLTCVGVVRGR